MPRCLPSSLVTVSVAALDGLQRGLAAAASIRFTSCLRIDRARHDVVGEDARQRLLVLRHDERVDGAGRQLAEGGVGRREHRERAGAGQRLDQAGRLHRRDQRRVVCGVDARSRRWSCRHTSARRRPSPVAREGRAEARCSQRNARDQQQRDKSISSCPKLHVVQRPTRGACEATEAHGAMVFPAITAREEAGTGLSLTGAGTDA